MKGSEGVQRTPSVQAVVALLEELAPPQRAETWDNVGLQVGDPDWAVTKAAVALEATDAVIEAAAAAGAALLVVHHPLIFRPLGALRLDEPVGRRIARLLAARVALYAAHTNFDASPGGTNDHLAASLGLEGAQVLAPLTAAAAAGAAQLVGHGRIGDLPAPASLDALAGRVRQALSAPHVRVVGDGKRRVQRVAVAAGAGASLAALAARGGADVLVTGDVKYHEAQAALDLGLCLIDPGHFSSEAAAMAVLAAELGRRLTEAGCQVVVQPVRGQQEPFRVL